MNRGIRDRASIGNSRWDWAKWGECFPRHILPTDVDADIHFKWLGTDHFLVIECKPNDFGEMKLGQRLYLEARARQPHTTVWVLEGDAMAMMASAYYVVPDWGSRLPITSEDLKALISGWFEMVSNA